jgi:thiol-disulfide isomerase/thioredoxin
MSHSVRGVLLGLSLAAFAGRPILAQEAGRPEYPRLAELEARFRKQAEDLERSKLAALAELARTSQGDESEAAYRALFDLAVARGLYVEAAPPARDYLSHLQGPYESHALAAAIVLIARAGRGEFDQSLADLEAFLKRRAAAHVPEDQRLPAALAVTVGEAYLQRLVEGGRLDIARKVCEIASAAHPDPAVSAHFKSRLARLALVGTAAPGIEGKDVDGRPVHLGDFKGKVVLIDFWATWCPPCVAEFPTLRQLARQHRDQGFAILGVNLDSLSQPSVVQAAKQVAPALDLRWFLLSQRASWPNLVGPGAEAAATAYGVSEIPARFLVSRDGKILQVELREQALEPAIARAVEPPGRP